MGCHDDAVPVPQCRRGRAAKASAAAVLLAAGLVLSVVSLGTGRPRGSDIAGKIGSWSPTELVMVATDVVEEGNCHTLVEGEVCHGDVLWAMQSGIRKNPSWYRGLTPDSSFEEFQAVMHKDRPNACPPPCVPKKARKEKAADEGMVARKSTMKMSIGHGAHGTEDDCHTAVVGESCYDHVSWVLNKGIYRHPNWYNGITKESSAAKVQEYLHREDKDICPKPCTHNSVIKARLRWDNSSRNKDGGSCHTAAEGEKCYDRVLWVLRKGITGDNKTYEGLTKASQFEEVQHRLHKDSTSTCPQPCACHTAVAGEKCHEAVVWVITEGIKSQPAWYPQLNQLSRFEEVQAFLHEEKHASCPKPCKPVPWGTPSLFCFSVIRSTGYEPEMVKAQLERGAGIFGCDEFAVFSDRTMSLGFGVKTATFIPAHVGTSKDGTAGNAKLFMHVWVALKGDFRARNLDWTLKVDPDAVILPDRLRTRLAPHTGKNTFIKNCGAYVGPGWPMMYGAVEVFSQKSVIAYFAGEVRCKTELAWQTWGEDVFMAACLEHLGVGFIADLTIVNDKVCKGDADCANGAAAAFHPFKSKSKWLRCWEQATA